MTIDNARPRPPLKPRKKRGGWRRGLATFFGLLTTLFLLLVLAGIGFSVYLIRATTAALPPMDALTDYMPGGVTEILATDKDPKTGQNLVLGRVYSEYRLYAPITEIPQTLQDSTIAIEDERFYSHSGIDFRGTVRAVFRDVAGHRMSQGGSTLTQQLARNVFLTQKRTFDRKIKEAFLAIELERNYTKQQILERYLNEVCYGSNTYGVRAAAQIYFGKPLGKLSIAEEALIAGLPQSPTAYDPFKHLDAAVHRRDEVLRHLVAQGYITPDQYRAALDEKPHLITLKMEHQTEFKAPYFTTYVLHQLTQKYGVDEVYRGGLKVYTTLNYQMQQEGERALINGVLGGREDHVSDGALVSIEPHSGYIRAMVGGMDFKKNQYNNVTQGKRQPGSSFKAFVYSTAFLRYPHKFDPDTDVVDAPVSFPGHPPYRPHNDDGRYGGDMSITRAFAKSVNVIAVKVANEVGIQNVIATAHSMGITSKLEPNLSLALGSNAVSPLEMATAYSVFANNGNHAQPMAVIRIVDGSGRQLENNDPMVVMNVLPPYVVSEMGTLTRAVVEHGTAAGAEGIHQVEDAHGKTGTTSNNRDAWFIGFTPELTTAVWVAGVKWVNVKVKGKVKRVPTYVSMNGITGGHICAPIWARFMLAAIPIQRQAGEKTPTPAPKMFVQDDRPRHRRIHADEGDQAATTESRHTPAPDASAAPGDTPTPSASDAPATNTPSADTTKPATDGAPATDGTPSGGKSDGGKGDSGGTPADKAPADTAPPPHDADPPKTPDASPNAAVAPPRPDPATHLANGQSAIPPDLAVNSAPIGRHPSKRHVPGAPGDH